MTVRANPAGIEEILHTIPDVISFKTEINPEEPNLYDVEIEVTPGTDCREKLFFAFADRRYPVRHLAKSTLSLEEIFLNLTEGGFDEEDED
jgi:ABC-2 type transport system ATP-binding protein